MKTIVVALSAALTLIACAADISPAADLRDDGPAYDDDVDVGVARQALGAVTRFGDMCDQFCIEYTIGASFGMLVQESDSTKVVLFDQVSREWSPYDEGFEVGDVETAPNEDTYYLSDLSTKRIKKHILGSAAQTIVGWSGELRGIKVNSQNIFWVDDLGLWRAKRSGASPTRLATITTAQRLLGLDATYAYVSAYDPSIPWYYIRRVNITTGASGVMRHSSYEPSSFTHNATALYWVERWGQTNKIYAVDKAPSGVHEIFSTNDWIFQLAASDSFVYWSEMPLAGGNMVIKKRAGGSTTVFTELTGAAFFGGLQVRGSNLYWMRSQTIGDPFGLERAPL